MRLEARGIQRGNVENSCPQGTGRGKKEKQRALEQGRELSPSSVLVQWDCEQEGMKQSWAGKW